MKMTDKIRKEMGKRMLQKPGSVILNGAEVGVIMSLRGRQHNMNLKVADGLVTDGVLFKSSSGRYVMTPIWKEWLG